MAEKSILIFVHNDFEELELLYPKYRLIEAGFSIVIAGPKKGEIYTGKHGYPCRADADFSSVKESDFEGVIIPGGYAPDRLRRDGKVLALVQTFHKKQKLVAYICHAGWVPISAGIVNAVKCTSTPAIKDDLMNAGASWVDEPVVVFKNHVSSRNPDDLPYFCKEIIRFLETSHQWSEK